MGFVDRGRGYGRRRLARSIGTIIPAGRCMITAPIKAPTCAREVDGDEVDVRDTRFAVAANGHKGIKVPRHNKGPSPHSIIAAVTGVQILVRRNDAIILDTWWAREGSQNETAMPSPAGTGFSPPSLLLSI